MRYAKNAALAASLASVAAGQSICDKYTQALLTDNTAANQFTVVALLVKTAALGNFTGPGSANPDLPGSMIAVPGLLAKGTVNGTDVDLMPYFNGGLASTNRNDMPVSVNFLDGGDVQDLINDPMAIGADGSNQATLFAHLVEYFGVLLGCSMYGMDGYPAYGGSNSQYNVHKYMDLSLAEFTWFNQNVGMAAASFGVTDADVMAAAMALQSTFGQRCAAPAAVVPDTMEDYQVICAGADCALAATPVASCSGDAAVPGFTPTEAAAVSTTSGSMSTTTDSGMSSSTTETGSMSTDMSTDMTTSSMAPTDTATTAAGSGGNAAPRQTAGAGVLLAAGAVAAALL